MTHLHRMTLHRTTSRLVRIVLTILCLSVLTAQVLFAVEPDEMLDDPLLEERARNISKQLSCPVCTGETIDDSHAGIAKDMRMLIREQIESGRSDDEVLDYVVSRYGDHVLLRTPLNARTLLLWAGPFVLLILGSALVWHVLATNRRAIAAESGDAATSLSEDETNALKRLLDQDK